ncbi:MAG: acetyl-CoA carboxylase biotin carboxyl carrier protein subunit [Prevotella sp.]
MQAKINQKSYDIELIEKEGNNVKIKLNGEIIEIDATLTETGFCSILHNGHSYNAEVVTHNEGKYIITADFRRYEVELQNPRKKYIRNDDFTQEMQDCIKAPMPGKIIAVLVEKGSQVKKGEPLLIIEAMKMQSTYTASQDAIVESVVIKEGDTVQSDQLLITFKHNN